MWPRTCTEPTNCAPCRALSLGTLSNATAPLAQVRIGTATDKVTPLRAFLTCNGVRPNLVVSGRGLQRAWFLAVRPPSPRFACGAATCRASVMVARRSISGPTVLTACPCLPPRSPAAWISLPTGSVGARSCSSGAATGEARSCGPCSTEVREAVFVCAWCVPEVLGLCPHIECRSMPRRPDRRAVFCARVGSHVAGSEPAGLTATPHGAA